ncbi:hypothetical protein MLD38_011706 [Melastoma candidum]|uniref:Uncharacterized protein n=1 Tax=Melastoma candidum TaxID=119954 RepID=A0ACB9R6Y3_9MYRT|nr:hypothetical protein MLD38_011706 [Melastoma candidum]
MDLRNPTRFRPVAPPQAQPSPSPVSADHDLTEDDIFSSFYFSSPSPSPTLPIFNHHRPSSLSASRFIPSLPRPPPPRDHHHSSSAPVNVPVLPVSRRRGDGGCGGFVDDAPDEVEEEEEDEVMRPPHEIVSRRSERLACSVLEGAGRTLKGRDLKRVRNAVWRQTGFLH